MSNFDTQIIIAVDGTRGDIHPFVGIAKNLNDAGFRTTFLINDYFSHLVRDIGSQFVSTGSTKSYLEHHADPRVWDPEYGSTELGWDRFYRNGFESSFYYVKHCYDENNNLAVVSIAHHLNGAATAAELLGLPTVRCTLAPEFIRSAIRPPAPFKWKVERQKLSEGDIKKEYDKLPKAFMKSFLCEEINQFRIKHGMSTLYELDLKDQFPTSQAHIGLFPPWYANPADDWPKNLNLVNFPLFDQDSEKSSTVVNSFIAKKGRPIIFTGGSAVYDNSDTFRVGVEACNRLDVPGLFVGAYAGDLNFNKSGHCHVDYVKFEDILPSCLVMVHHGGIGTIAQAIRARIPQIIRPVAYDQFDNADRVHSMGLGSFILPDYFSADNLVKCLHDMIETRLFDSSLSFYGSLIQPKSGTREAADLIIDYLEKPRENYKGLLQSRVLSTKQLKETFITFNPDKYVVPNRKCDGHFEALSFLINHYQVSGKLNYREYILLDEVVSILCGLKIRNRVIECSRSSLVKVKHPSLIQWRYNRFIVLLGFDSQIAYLFDPFVGQREIDIQEFNWFFSGIAIEVLDYE